MEKPEEGTSKEVGIISSSSSLSREFKFNLMCTGWMDGTQIGAGPPLSPSLTELINSEAQPS